MSLYFILPELTLIIMIVASVIFLMKSESPLIKAGIIFLIIALIQRAVYSFGAFYDLAYMGSLEYFFPYSLRIFFVLIAVILFRFYAFKRVLIENKVQDSKPEFITVVGYFLAGVPISYLILNGSKKDRLVFKLFFHNILLIIGFMIIQFYHKPGIIVAGAILTLYAWIVINQKIAEEGNKNER